MERKSSYMMTMILRARRTLEMLSTLMFVPFMAKIFHIVFSMSTFYIGFLSRTTLSQCNGFLCHRFSQTALLLHTFLSHKAVKLYKTLILHKTLEILHTTGCRSNFPELALERSMRLSNNFSPPPRPNLGNCTSVKY